MPERSVEAFDPKGLRLGTKFYSKKDIARIVEAAGELPAGNIAYRHYDELVDRRVALTERLESAARIWAYWSDYQVRPTAIQLATAFDEIERTSARLLQVLRVPDDGNVERMPPAIRFGGLQKFAGIEAEQLGGVPEHTGAGILRQAVAGVSLLRRFAADARDSERDKSPTAQADRNSGDKALDEFFLALAKIYTDIWDRKVKTSVGGAESSEPGQAIGPMVRFFHQCLRPLLKDVLPSDKAIRVRIRRVAGDMAKSAPK